MKRICVIEDELSLSELIKMNLELEGYFVEVITHGTEAFLRAFEMNKFDLVVLDVMLPQLQHYILSLLIINTEGPDNMSLYPFDNIKSGKNLVLYSGGTLGQHMYKKIINNKEYNIVAWIDEKHKHYSKLNLPVSKIDKIKNINYDAILVALIDEDNSNTTYTRLIEYGVTKEKIIQIPYYNKSKNIQNQLLKHKINL